MAFANLTNTRIDPFLTAHSLSVDTTGFIWDKALTPVSTPEMSGSIPYIGNAQLRNFNAVRAPGDRDSHEVRIEIQTAPTYSIEDYDLSITNTNGELRKAQAPFDNFNLINSMTLGKNKQIIMEAALYALLGSTSVMTNYATPSTLWDVATSDPFGDIKTAIDAVRLKIGKKPQYVATSYTVISALQTHPDFLARINGIQKVLSEGGVVDILKAEFGLKEVYVSEAIYDSAVLGQTASNANLFGDDFVIYHKAQSAMQMEPTLGMNFTFNGKGAQEGIAKSNLLNSNGAPIGQTWTNFWSRGLTVCQADAGYLLDQVIS